MRDYDPRPNARRAATQMGKPCLNGHSGERYVKRGDCVACVRERRHKAPLTDVQKAERSERLRLEKNARRREARANDPTYRRRATGYQLASERRDPERARERKAEWYRDHPETKRAQTNRYRCGKINAPGCHSQADAFRILEWQGGCCAYCDATDGLQLDHGVPLARGGSNWPWNMQWLCAHHNASKGARTDAEYRKAAGLPEAELISLQIWRAVFVVL